MRVLIAAASRCPAPVAVAEAVRTTLRQRGLVAISIPIDDEPDVAPYQAVVVGSCVHNRHWDAPAEMFVYTNSFALHSKRVWLFSTGPVRAGSHLHGRPLSWRQLLDATDAHEHRVFGEPDPRLAVAGVGPPSGQHDTLDVAVASEWAMSVADALIRPRTRSA